MWHASEEQNPLVERLLQAGEGRVLDPAVFAVAGVGDVLEPDNYLVSRLIKFCSPEIVAGAAFVRDDESALVRSEDHRGKGSYLNWIVDYDFPDGQPGSDHQRHD